MNLSSVLSDIGSEALKVVLSNNNTDDIDEAIELLTTPSYSDLYGTYKSVTTGDSEMGYSTITIDDNSALPTASTATLYEAWDPRLARVDGFVLNKGGNHPTIVPFSSTTAAGAFFDLVFTTTKKVDDIVMNLGGYDSNNDITISAGSASSGSTETTSNGEVSQSEFVMRAKDDTKSLILNSGNSYGIASIVNPYTLTKLCGGLVKSNVDEESGAVSVENHMYDVRDSRRFYGNVVTDDSDVLTVTNPTTTNIITWSNKDKWGRTPYYFQDFVFSKFWGKIPNNHLITLRKYHAPVYDNLLFSSMNDTKANSETGVLPFAPIATVVTYFGDDTGNTLLSLFSFTTGTKWRDIKADVHTVSGDTGSDPHAVIDDMFTNGGGFPTGESNPVSSIIKGANFLTGKMFSFGKFVGLLSPDGYNINKDLAYFDRMSLANVDPMENLYNNKILGPVNRVDATKARDSGIVFDLKLSICCQYVARPIGGVNTKAAMLDILSNCMEIASVDAMFWGGGYRFMIHPQMYPFKNTAFKNQIMDDLYAGRIFGRDGALAHTVEGVKKFGTTDKNGNNTGSFDWSNITGKLGEFLGETMGAIGELLASVSNVIFGNAGNLSEWFKSAGDEVGGDGAANKGAQKLNALGKNLNLMWRSLVVLHSVMPSVSGMKAILTGEPVGNWHVTVGNPLNPIMVIGNLICTDMKVESGNELGPDDFPLEIKVTYTLEHGMMRDKSAIQSMFNRGSGRIYQLPDWVRASSDYETKVDNYTGTTTGYAKGGFTTPHYMSASSMMAMGGSGFLTYKLSPAKELAVNSHTSNTVIAKFTPPDIDAAVSNIKDSTSFFSANAGSRAWIRGIAATRKLMN